MSASYLCGVASCGASVTGIYCPTHREERAKAQREAREANAQRLRDLWKADPEGMKAKLQAGRAPATEGA